LAYFDVTKPVKISCDASKSGLGAVLLHKGKPVSCDSRPMERVMPKLKKNF